jgi:malate dehydrogenase (oxaloacetate-decarboxylating)(NADP+)
MFLTNSNGRRIYHLNFTLGNKEIILELKKELGFYADLEIIDPKIKRGEIRKTQIDLLYIGNQREENEKGFHFDAQKKN